MKQTVILVTGHVCSGKTTLYKYLVHHGFDRVDVAAFYSRHKDIDSQNKYFRVIFEEMLSAVFNSLFSMKNVYVELIGNECFFSIFKHILNKSSYDVIEVELQRSSKNLAIEALNNRNQILKKSEENKKNEVDSILSTHGCLFNKDAILYETTLDNISIIANSLLEKIGVI